MPDIYDDYKPLRNYLRNTNLLDSLGAIRWYIAYHHFKKKDLPHSDMQVDPIFYKNPMNPMIYLAPWHLAVLARELVINAPDTSILLLHDFRKWNDLANATNKLKAIDEAIAKAYINQGNVLQHLSKVMSHEQFVWQENRPNKQTMDRYYHIYRHPAVRPIFEKIFGMSVEKYFVLGTVSWFQFSHQLGMNYPPNLDFQTVKITIADYDLFLGHYALTMDELKQKLQESPERRIEHDFMYYFDSLKQYPLIFTTVQGKPTHICPVPTYMFWRTTDGIYYELVGEKGFDQAIGLAFKEYIGEVMAARAYAKSVTVLDGDTFIAKQSPKPDWIVAQAEVAAFVECKAKRMTLEARNEADYGVATEQQIEKLAESVIQAYAAILDAQGQKYKELTAVKRYHPIVVTMETWFVFGDITRKLNEKVHELAMAKGMDEAFITANQFLVLSSQEYEFVSALLETETLADIVEPFLDDTEYEEWQFATYLLKRFPGRSSYAVFEKSLVEEVVERVERDANDQNELSS